MFGALYLKNFRCYEDTEISFKNGRGVVNNRIYLFGDNASGKTSLLHAFLFLKQNLVSLNEYKEEGRSFTQNIRRNFRHHAKSDMVIIYEFVINKQKHLYEVVYNLHMELVSESLVRTRANNVEVLFSASREELVLNSNMYIIEDYDLIFNHYKKYFGEYSFLSILYYGSKKNIMKLKSGAYKVLEFIELGVYSIDRESPYHINMLRGRAREQLKVQLEDTQKDFSVFISSVFTSISHVEFAFEKISDQRYAYSLRVFGVSKDGPYLIETSDMPHSLYAFLHMVIDLLSLFNGTFGIFDYFDYALDIHSLTALIQFIESTIKGQLFISFNSLDIINALKPSNIFIASQNPNQDHVVTMLQHFAPTQSNHNVRKRYEEGLYSNDIPLQERSQMKFTNLKKSLSMIHKN